MELLQVVLAHLLANVTTTIFFSVAYLNFVLFKDYIWTLLWSFVISQALYASKARLMKAIAALSREDDPRPVLAVLWELITEPFWRMHGQGTRVHDIVFRSTLNWCIELFALVGLMSLTYRLLSVWLVVATMLALLPFLGILHTLDRRVFAYRNVVSDDVLASTVVICTFFASVCFIVLFLGLESALEGVSAGQSVSTWVQSKLDDETEWSNNIARIAGFANETAVGFEAQYNETVWFPMARDAISRYMEHGTLMATSDTGEDDSKRLVVDGFMGMGGFSGLVSTLREHMSGLDISMEHIVEYLAPSGKVIANGVTLLATFGSFLIMLGFKVVLLFTCVVYMTSHDDFLERTVGDFLPIAREDQKRAMNLLRGAIQGVFFLPCKVACLHGVVTLFSFTVLQIEFPFFAAFMSVLTSILPIVPAYVVCWPWAMTLVMHGRWVGAVLAISQYFILSIIDTELCAQGVEEANPYLTGLSSFLGFAVYGAQGVLLGPLIICLATLIYGWLGFLGSSIPQADEMREYASVSSDAEVDADVDEGEANAEVDSTTAVASKTGIIDDASIAADAGINDGDIRECRASTSAGVSAYNGGNGDAGGGGGGYGQENDGTVRWGRSISSSFYKPTGRKGPMLTRPKSLGTRDVVPSLQLGELCSSFVRNLNLQSTQRSSRSSSDVYTDRARLHRRQSDSGVADTSVRNRYSSGKGGIYSTLSAAYSGRVKITLHLKPAGVDERSSSDGGYVHDGHDSEDSSPHVDTSWRLHVSRAWAWETFLREVEDVMGIPGVSGVYGKDGARIRRVQFIEDGETLDVVPTKL